MLPANSPIGIFDSGIGGLTVAAAIHKLLPEEQLIYFGDTAHVPYGDKSEELIRTYAERITNFLLNEKKCKAIVIACNTASAAAYSLLRDRYKGAVPVINVIDPMIEAVIADDEIKSVGIIATKTTISSGVYQEKFSRRKPSLIYHALPTPLLAGMIEEGFYNNNISTAILEQYLSYPPFQDIDGLVLACTHYPLIKNEINTYFNGKVKLFDSAQVVAARLQWILQKENLLSEKRCGNNHFYVSDFTESFEHSTHIFFGHQVQLQHITLS
ncbi:MAG: glutamate racemase [Bacteroidetes bacterium]|nr:glutamate racemase [Bacteroidota bacterium]